MDLLLVVKLQCSSLELVTEMYTDTCNAAWREVKEVDEASCHFSSHLISTVNP
jgi:hypothetical protein